MIKELELEHPPPPYALISKMFLKKLLMILLNNAKGKKVLVHGLWYTLLQLQMY